MSRFERWLYVVLVAVILVWPGVRQQFILQIRQITHTTDVRVGSWPTYTTGWPEPSPVPMKRLEPVAKEHGLWEGLAELQAVSSGDKTADPDAKAAISSLEKALAADPESKVVHVRLSAQRIRWLDFYRPEERAIDEEQLSRRLQPYPEGISEKQAKPALELALAGQKLDPRNSYYDYMLARIYVGLQEDDQAIMAINRGARKPVFDLYQKEAALNTRSLLIEAGAPALEATRNWTNWNGYFSLLARLRRFARTMSAIAQQAEEEGDWRRGWEIRLAVFRMGDQITSAGQEHLTLLVGTAIESIATGHLPCTREQAEQLKKAANDRERYGQITAQILRDYVGKHHLGAEGNWMLSRFEAMQEFRRLYTKQIEKESGLTHWFFNSSLAWFATTSLLAGLLTMLALLGILSLPRRVREADGGRAARIMGRAGVGLTAAGWCGAVAWFSRNVPISVPISLTWGLIVLLPALILIFGLARRRPSLASIRTSARYALPVFAVIYVIFSGFLAIERGAIERHALQSIEHGLEPKQIEILKKTGFRR